MQQLKRCGWAGTDPRMVAYHDREWGVPVHDDRLLFEFLVLEGAQAGLSWQTILNKRDAYREAFASSTRRASPASTPGASSACSSNPGIVRNRLKIESAVGNARALLERAARNRQLRSLRVETSSAARRGSTAGVRRGMFRRAARASDALSAELKRRGFRFVGSTICYAFMQATGMVNDHLLACHRYAELARL